eukprot:1184015-Prorocentrum_minimum.AAC.1
MKSWVQFLAPFSRKRSSYLCQLCCRWRRSLALPRSSRRRRAVRRAWRARRVSPSRLARPPHPGTAKRTRPPRPARGTAAGRATGPTPRPPPPPPTPPTGTPRRTPSPRATSCPKRTVGEWQAVSGPIACPFGDVARGEQTNSVAVR